MPRSKLSLLVAYLLETMKKVAERSITELGLFKPEQGEEKAKRPLLPAIITHIGVSPKPGFRSKENSPRDENLKRPWVQLNPTLHLCANTGSCGAAGTQSKDVSP